MSRLAPIADFERLRCNSGNLPTLQTQTTAKYTLERTLLSSFIRKPSLLLATEG
jgi:hypothetical protein